MFYLFIYYLSRLFFKKIKYNNNFFIILLVKIIIIKQKHKNLLILININKIFIKKKK